MSERMTQVRFIPYRDDPCVIHGVIGRTDTEPIGVLEAKRLLVTLKLLLEDEGYTFFGRFGLPEPESD